MTTTSAVATSENSKTSAMRSRGLDELIGDRRKALWTFLTWAFCLWDVAKAEDAHPMANRADEGSGRAFARLQEDGNACRSPTNGRACFAELDGAAAIE